MMNVITMQRHIFNANTSMDISTMMNILTTQLGTSCSFDSPGLARNEPTPGQRSQGDSTPFPSFHAGKCGKSCSYPQ